MNLLTCLHCFTPFIGEFNLEPRPVFESLKKMRQAGRDTQKRVGVEPTPVCPALCEDCRKQTPAIPFVTDWESEE